jgi:CHASE2 domain-containing sensor protein
MLQRPGCWTPISLLFVVGSLLVVGGLMAESRRPVIAGVWCLVATAGLLGVGWWLRRQGWWD